MTENNKINDRVRRSVNPNNRIKAWGSSGPISLYRSRNDSKFINILLPKITIFFHFNGLKHENLRKLEVKNDKR